MAVVFRKMCDGCHRTVGDNEDMFAFKLIDDEGAERIYKGHKGCMDDLVDMLGQLYGMKEGSNSES